MTHADDPGLTNEDKQAIEAIRRQLDREFGPLSRDPDRGEVCGMDRRAPAPIVPAEPNRPTKGLRLALAAGVVTLVAALIGALVSFVNVSSLLSPSRGPAPRVSHAPTVAAPEATDSTPPHGRDDTVAGAAANGLRRTADSAAGSRPPREPSRGGVLAQHRRGSASPAIRERAGAHISPLPVSRPPVILIQAP
jgi:hypothetical protein